MEQPKGRTRISSKEKQTILTLRLRGYSLKQISEMTGRSATSVKRVVYNW